MDEGAVLEHEGAFLSKTAEITKTPASTVFLSRRDVSPPLISSVADQRRDTLLLRRPLQSTSRSTPWCTSRHLRRTRASTRTRAHPLRLVPTRQRSPKRSFRRGFAHAGICQDASVPGASPRLHGPDAMRTAPSTRSRTSSCRGHTRDPTAPLGTLRDRRKVPVRASEVRARGAAEGRRTTRRPPRGERPRRRRARVRRRTRRERHI